MPPDPNQPWPPRTWQPIQQDITEAAAWWSGNEDDLVKAAAGKTAGPSVKGKPRGLRRFWARQEAQEQTDRQRLHIPIAADIASTSADLLYGEPPQFVIPEAHATKADPEAKAAQTRVLQLADDDAWISRLLESAEISSGLGGIYMRALWDPQAADHPLLTTIQADNAVPEFRWGRLTAVTFWSVVARDGARVWRHLERHQSGLIRHTLHEGTKDRLGPSRPLDANPATATLDVQPDGTVLIPPELADRLLVEYIPNMLPNRAHRHMPIGRPDGAGTWPLMDALDETWSAWMRDIRLAKARIIVPDQYLDRRPRQGASFDADREVFSPLDIEPGQETKSITLSQFEIRSADHAATAAGLVEHIISAASYAPATFGIDSSGRGEATATGVRAREAKSLRTTQRKQAYQQRISRVLETLLVIDRVIFRSGVEPYRPRIQFADGLPDDPAATAQTIMLLGQAEAVSIETRVRMAQPHLDEAEVAAEVQRIREESSTLVPDPTGGFPTGEDAQKVEER